MVANIHLYPADEGWNENGPGMNQFQYNFSEAAVNYKSEISLFNFRASAMPQCERIPIPISICMLIMTMCAFEESESRLCLDLGLFEALTLAPQYYVQRRLAIQHTLGKRHVHLARGNRIATLSRT